MENLGNTLEYCFLLTAQLIKIIEELTGNHSLKPNSLLLTTKEDVLTNQYVIQFYDYDTCNTFYKGFVCVVNYFVSVFGKKSASDGNPTTTPVPCDTLP